MHLSAPFFDKVFEGGGFYEFESSDDVRRAGRLLESEGLVRLEGRLLAHSHYLRPPPKIYSCDEHFLSHLKTVYDDTQKRFQSYSGVYELKFSNATICNSLVYCKYRSHYHLIYYTCRANDRPYLDVLSGGDLTSGPPPVDLNYANPYYIASAGSFNYGHWLTDDLPRIAMLGGKGERMQILLHSYGDAIDKIRSESIRYFLGKLGCDIVFLKRDVIYNCNGLKYITPVSHHPVVKNSHAIDAVYRGRKKHLRNILSPKKIFITRGKNAVRKIANHGEVEAYLSSIGFASIDTYDLSFSEQVSAFSSCEWVVGVMGAAMANTIFCAPAAKILYLAPNEWVEPYYWDLAGAKRQQYLAIHGQRAGINSQPHLDNFSIDLDVMREAIKSIAEG